MKRLAASTIDIAVATCLGWFVVNLITQEWYPYRYLAWGLPLTYWFYESYCLIALDGSSLGRRLFDIQVVSSVGRTELAKWQAILRPGTRVVIYGLLVIYVSPDPVHQMDLAAFPYLAEAALLFTPMSLTIADVVTQTRVVNTPPPQPHRAPAGPMYSSTDAEFGYPPRRHK
jgi:uncharacterized RDD family membrane protein YckC